MRTATVEYKIYNYDELTEESKERVRIDNSMNDVSIYTEMLSSETFPCMVSQFGFSGVNVYFSLNHCQGDGVSFSTDNLDINKFVKLNLTSSINDNNRDISEWTKKYIAKKGLELTEKETRRLEYMVDELGYSIEIGQQGNYCHSGTVRIYESFYIDYSGLSKYQLIDKLADKIRKYLETLIEDLCKEMEKVGYAQFDYLYTDEYARDTAESNSYEYLEDGSLWTE